MNCINPNEHSMININLYEHYMNFIHSNEHSMIYVNQTNTLIYINTNENYDPYKA
jgi:hypothetical protein